MTRLKLLALLPLAISSVAFAADNATGSEYMHQTAASKWEVTPQIEYHDWFAKFNSQSLNSKTEVSGMTYGVKGEYGINDMFSAGINISGASDSWKYTMANGGAAPANGSASGLNNIDVYGLGKYDLGGSTLRYGLDFAISTSSHTDNTSSGSYSEDTGGTGVTPFVGWEMAMGPGIFGVKLSYYFLLSNRSYSSTPNTITSENGVSAQSLTAFYEWMQNNWSLGLALSYNGVTGSKTTTVSGSNPAVDSGHAGLFVNVYAPIVVADSITIIPSIGYGDNGQQLDANFGSLTTWNGWDIGVKARFAF